MSRFSDEDKLNAVLSYLNGNESYFQIAKRIGVAKSAVILWVSLYKQNGASGLIKRYTNYSPEFKMDVLNYMEENRLSITEAATKFNIPSLAQVSQWKKRFEIYGYDGLFQRKRGRPSMNKTGPIKGKKHVEPGSIDEILEENERLRMENAYLKKLNALVQKERKLKNDKKR